MDRHQQAAVIEVLGRDGQVRAVHKIQSFPAYIGRSPVCEVVLDDAHLAAEHALIHWNEAEGASLQLLPSLNGGWLGEQRLSAGESAPLTGSSQFQLGATTLRWRSTAAALAPELPLERHQHRSVPPSALGLVLLPLWLLWLAFDKWLEVDPGSRIVDYVGPVLGPLGAVLAWTALWSLVNQLFQHRFPFTLHLRRVLVWLLAMVGLSVVLPALAYALNLPRLLALEELIAWPATAALIWWHASLVWPRARRAMGGALIGLLVLGLGLNVARRQEQQYWFGPSYMSALPPPALRLASPKPPEALIEELRSLQPRLADQARKDNEQAAPEED